jgi:hypothetical protein
VGLKRGVFGVASRRKILSLKTNWSQGYVYALKIKAPWFSLRSEVEIQSGMCEICFKFMKEQNCCLRMRRRCHKECITLSKPRTLAFRIIMTSTSNVVRYLEIVVCIVWTYECGWIAYIVVGIVHSYDMKLHNMMFTILREWDPLKIILAIWTPKSHVRLINTRLYFRRVVSIEMRVCWARESTQLGWVDLNEDNMLSN